MEFNSGFKGLIIFKNKRQGKGVCCSQETLFLFSTLFFWGGGGWGQNQPNNLFCLSPALVTFCYYCAMITFVKTVSHLMSGVVDLLRRASLSRIFLLNLVAASKKWCSLNILQWQKCISCPFERSSGTLNPLNSESYSFYLLSENLTV